MAPPTAIVTGASGFAGRHLVARLAGSRRLVGWHRPGGTPPDPSLPVRWAAVDILDSEAVARGVADARPAEIFHLAGAPHVASSWRNAEAQLRTNVLGTHHVLEAARTAKLAARVLVVSSAQIYRAGDEPLDERAPRLPANPYGVSKLAADDLALRAAVDDGLAVVVARPFNHAGPGQSPDFVVSSFARQIAMIESGRAAPEISVGNLDARRDLTDVRDVADAYVRLMEGGATGQPYNICSGRAWRIGDLLDELVHLAHTPVRVVVDTARLRVHDHSVIQGDASRIRAELGWAPTIRVEQTLRDTLDWWRNTLR